MKNIYLLLTIAFGIFSLFAVTWQKKSNMSSTPAKIVQKYYELAAEEKWDEALSLWKDCNPKGVCSKANLISGQEPIESWTKTISKDRVAFNIEEEKIENDKASVLVSAKYQNGYINKTIYKLVLIDEKWILWGISTPAMEQADKQAEKNNNINKIESN